MMSLSLVRSLEVFLWAEISSSMLLDLNCALCNRVAIGPLRWWTVSRIVPQCLVTSSLCGARLTSGDLGGIRVLMWCWLALLRRLRLRVRLGRSISLGLTLWLARLWVVLSMCSMLLALRWRLLGC